SSVNAMQMSCLLSQQELEGLVVNSDLTVPDSDGNVIQF
ncbi:unnamed protein product, partial [Rotaria sordida]